MTLTQLFAPALDSSSPSSSSRRQAFCTVFGLSPSIAESTLREGSSSPSAISPETIPCFTNRIICKYIGEPSSGLNPSNEITRSPP